MSSEVTRYDAVHLRYEDSNIRYGEGCEVEVVTATDYAALEAECERLRQFQIAYNDWQAKTDWVQESAKPNELGRHRADVLRARIEALAAELAAIKGQEAVDCKVVPVELLEQIAVELEHDNDRYFLGRELLERAASMELDTIARSIRIQDEIRAILAADHALMAEKLRGEIEAITQGCPVQPPLPVDSEGGHCD